MPTRLYCLLPAGSELEAPPSVRTLAPAQGVIAWVSDSPTDKLSRDARDAARATIEHDRIVGAALAQGVTPVPALLTDPYGDDIQASTDIVANVAEVIDALEHVSGMVEMTTIIAVEDAPPVDAAGQGRAYLEQLRSRPARAASIANRVAAAVSDAVGLPRARSDGGRVALSHLVRRESIGEYRRVMLGQAGAGYKLVIDGPRAPYSYAAYSPRNGIRNVEPASRHKSGEQDRDERQ